MLSQTPYNVCEETLAVVAHTISIVKNIAKDGQSGILMPFGVANIFPHKKNNV